MKKLLSVLLAASMLVACQPQGYNTGNGGIGGTGISKEGAGTVLGGVGGALLGSQVGGGTGRLVAVGVGTLLGAAIGNGVGSSLDRADLNYSQAASQQALNTNQNGQPLPWSNPQSGVSGTVIPNNYYQNSNGQYCREYTQRINVGGRVQEGHGNACRQADGSWQIVQ